MKIALFSDWFKGKPSYGGGGETYAINLATLLVKKHDVTIFTNKVADNVINYIDVLKYYGLSNEIIDQLKIKYAPTVGWAYPQAIYREIHTRNYLKRRIKDFDLFINCSESTMNGFANCKDKIPSLKIVHFPWGKMKPNFVLPFINKKYYDYQNKFETSYDIFLPNSQFTASWAYKFWNNPNIKILYPAISYKKMDKDDLKDKENIILYTGRIIDDKKCLELAQVFKNIHANHKDWKLIIAGNYIPGQEAYYDKIKKELIDTDYKLLFNLKQEDFTRLYKKAKIFWTAKGFGENEAWKMEHFGMTTVEAMANGCVPVVINKGGQPEIVNYSNDLTWDTLIELEEKVSALIQDPEKLYKLSFDAIKQSEKFLLPSFKKHFVDYVNDILIDKKLEL